MNNLDANTFFDINKLPSEKGLLLFPLSMSKLSNRQSAEHCIEDVRHFSPNKISKPLVGLNFIYGDFLYLYSDKPAPELKHSFMNQVIHHKNSVDKLLEKNNVEFQIQHAFNYMVWNQLYVGTRDFSQRFDQIKKLYAGDMLFQKYLKEDCEAFERGMEDNQVNFFLEEVTMMYLLSKNQVKLPNEYVENNQKWILWCYPGRPLKSAIYVYQINPFNLNWSESPFQNCHYDLEAKELVDFGRVDLESYKVR